MASSARNSTTFGKYVVIQPIGLACNVKAYKAYDPERSRYVLIRHMSMLRGADDAVRQRFRRQAALEARLQHPNVLALHDIGEESGAPYLVEEYVDGETLDAIIESGRPIPLAEKLRYVIEVCKALTYVHGKGLVHRNIKAANILVACTGEVKLFDFSCTYDGNASPPATERTGQICGTLTHMAPEQICGQVPDARADVFGVGVVLYHLLAGALPFQGIGPAAILMAILNDSPPCLPASLGNSVVRLQEITFLALAKDRSLRYQTAEDLASDLVSVQSTA